MQAFYYWRYLKNTMVENEVRHFLRFVLVVVLVLVIEHKKL